MFFSVAKRVTLAEAEFTSIVQAAAGLGIVAVDVEIFPMDDFCDCSEGEVDVSVEFLLFEDDGVFDPVVLNGDETDEGRTDDNHQYVDEASFHTA